MSDPRLLELAQMPLQQRALHIAELFSEGADDQNPPAPNRTQRRAQRKAMLTEKPAAILARHIRALRYWLAPSQAPRLIKNLVLAACQITSREKIMPAAGARADGFCGRAASLDPYDLNEVFLRGMTPRSLLGMTVLWSPPVRAVLRPEDFPRNAGERRSEAQRVGLDERFDQVLALCAAAQPAHERMPALDLALGDMHDAGFAHSLAIFDGAGALVAGVIGVAAGGIFTIERIFAEDEEAFSRGMNSLAAQLQRWNFALIDFKSPSVWSDLLRCAKMNREAFCAFAAAHACGGRHGRWRIDADLRHPARPAAAPALKLLARAQSQKRTGNMKSIGGQPRNSTAI